METLTSNSTLNTEINLVNNFTNDIAIKKQQGVFFTENNDIIDNIIDIIDIKNITNKLILEPSCGNGNLIIALMNKIHNYFNSKQIMKSFLSNNLIFNDIDEVILNDCVTNIQNTYKILYNEELNIKLNYFNLDFTKKHSTLFDISKLNFYKNKIDYIIGNPPYITLYGRRDKKKNENLRQYFLTNYKQFPKTLKNGKINYIMLFIENGLEFLKKDGILSYIIDASFNETPYKWTRQFLYENYNFLEIITNIKGFDNVNSGQNIIKIQNNRSINTDTKIINYKSGNTWLTSKNNLCDLFNEYKLSLNENNINEINIFNKIKQKTQEFQKIYKNKTIRTCSMLLNLEHFFIKEVDNNYILSSNEYYYYVGSKSLTMPFCKLQTNKVLIYNKKLQDEINNELKKELEEKNIKNKKRVSMGDKETFVNPKLFIRQSAKKIICSFDNLNITTANNSLYLLSFKDNNIKSINELLFLCGYLNSSIITFYAQKQNIIRYFIGKQPQIKISDLNKLPIIEDNDIKNKIINIVNELYSKKDNNNYLYYIKLIDNILYNYFMIDDCEISYINNEINNF